MKKSKIRKHFLATAAALGVLSSIGTAFAQTAPQQPAQRQTSIGDQFRPIQTDPDQGAPGDQSPHPCAPLDNVPQTPTYKVWNDLRAQLKNATTINGDLQTLASSGVTVCMVPIDDTDKDAMFMIGVMDSFVAYNYLYHAIYVVDTVPPQFPTDKLPENLRTLPELIGQRLPQTLEDGLMNVNYGDTSTSLINPLALSIEMTPEALATNALMQMTTQKIMMIQRAHDLAQAGLTFDYQDMQADDPGFVAAYEAKVVNGPPGRSLSDRLWALFQDRVQDQDERTRALTVADTYLDSYLQNQASPGNVPGDAFKTGFDPGAIVDFTADSASYLTSHARDLADFAFAFDSKTQSPQQQALIADIKKLSGEILGANQSPAPTTPPPTPPPAQQPIAFFSYDWTSGQPIRPAAPPHLFSFDGYRLKI